jgi:hypothetical protein
MSSFVQELSSYLKDSQDKLNERERERDEQVEKLQEMINKSSTSHEDKATLKGVADVLINANNNKNEVLDSSKTKGVLFNHFLFSKLIGNHLTGISDAGRNGRILEEGEATGVSKRMKAFIEEQVGIPKAGHIRLMAPLTQEESVKLYNAVLEEFPGALDRIPINTGREVVASAANDFLTKISRTK